MSKSKEEPYIDELVKRDKGVPMIDRIYKKGCGHCGNDLHQPYNYCHFCGYRIIKEASNESETK